MTQNKGWKPTTEDELFAAALLKEIVSRKGNSPESGEMVLIIEDIKRAILLIAKSFELYHESRKNADSIVRIIPETGALENG